MKYIFTIKISCEHENRRGRIELPSRPVLAPRLYVWQLRINSKNPYLYCEFSLVLHKSQKPEVNSKRSHEQEWANKVPQAGHYLLVFFFFLIRLVKHRFSVQIIWWNFFSFPMLRCTGCICHFISSWWLTTSGKFGLTHSQSLMQKRLGTSALLRWTLQQKLP